MTDFFYPGPVDLFVMPRTQGSILTTFTLALPSWKYLGTAVVSPVVDESVLHRDLKCDRSVDAPWQKVSGSEKHIVSVLTNRINYETLNALRNRNNPAKVRYEPKPGKLIFNYKDMTLFLRYSNPFGGLASFVPPPGSPKGRLYYSASLERSRYTQPSRSNELGLVFECCPLWDNANRKWLFWSEADADLPTLTPE